MGGEDDLYISGPKVDLSGREIFLGEFLFKSLKKQDMDKVFQVIIDSNEQMTFKELFTLGAQICQGLIQRGLQRGDIVSLIDSNTNGVHATFLGAVWAGGVPHPVGSDLKLVELKTILEQAKPKWIFCEPKSVEIVSDCLKYLPNNPKLVLIDSSSSHNKDHLTLQDILGDVDLNNFTPQTIDSPDELALILCSSGTTGIPKCVALTHNLLLNLHLWEYIDEIDFKRPHLLTSSFSWITGVYFLMLSCIYGCFRVITTLNEPTYILKAIQDYKLYGAMIPPPVIKAVLEHPDLRNYDVSSLKEVWTGGSVLGGYTIERFQKEWPDKRLCQCYGLTEAGGMVTKPALRQFPSSIGRIFQNTDIKIADPITRKGLGPKEIGEICIRSECLFKTYVGNEEATKDAMENGWLKTGDIGFYSEDGHLYITSRIKEIIKIDNNQISPTEIESYLSSLPGVADVGVAGIDFGEYTSGLMAIIIKNPDSTITADYVSRKVEENFSKHKHLTAGVYFVDHLPRSISGKLKRKDLYVLAEKLYSTRNEAQK